MRVVKAIAAAFAVTVAVGIGLIIVAIHFAGVAGDALAAHVFEPVASAVIRTMDGMSYHPVADRPNITVTDVWSRATPGGGSGVLYLTITAADAPDRLIAASTARATMAQLHESFLRGTVSSMRPVDAVPVGPGASVSLKPGGYHFMLLGLKTPLTAGETFPVTLTFEQAGDIIAQARVAPAGAASMPGMTGMDHGKM